MTTVAVLCTLGCGVEIPVPVRIAASDGAADLNVKVGIAPEFDAQLDWHMRRFHSPRGPRGGLPVEVAA